MFSLPCPPSEWFGERIYPSHTHLRKLFSSQRCVCVDVLDDVLVLGKPGKFIPESVNHKKTTEVVFEELRRLVLVSDAFAGQSKDLVSFEYLTRHDRYTKTCIEC